MNNQITEGIAQRPDGDGYFIVVGGVVLHQPSTKIPDGPASGHARARIADADDRRSIKPTLPVQLGFEPTNPFAWMNNNQRVNDVLTK